MFKTAIRGGQHLTHNVSMLRQIIKFALNLAIIAYIILLLISILDQRYLTLNGSRACIYELKEYKNKVISHLEICPEISNIWYNIIIKNFYIIPPVFGLALLFYLFYGFIISKKTSENKMNNIMSPWLAKIIIRAKNRASSISIKNVPLIKNTENKHILILGDTGTGKTTALKDLLKQIRRNKEKAIILDIADTFTDDFREYGDYIIHPGRSNSVYFDPFENCYKNKWLTASIAKSICISSNLQDPFWQESAQTILTSLITKFHNSQDIEKVIKLPLKDLHNQLIDTPAHHFVNPNIDKTALSSVATLMSKLNFISILDPEPKHKFNFEDWDDQDKSWLFLRSGISERATLIPYFRSIMSYFFNTRDSNKKYNRTWLIVDEFAALENFTIFTQMISELRKYNVCIVVATQNKAQIDENYGKSSNTILSNFGTNLIFRCSEPNSAKWLEQKIGGDTISEKSESISYGANTHRDGVTLAERKNFVPFITANGIQTLNTLEAILVLPENIVNPIKIRF